MPLLSSNLRQRLKGLLSFRNSTLAQPDDWMRELFSPRSASGAIVSPLTAMGVPTVYACVNAVSRSISSIPLKFYRRLPDGGKEPAVEHRLYSLLHDSPNEEMTSSDFRRCMQANATLRNDAYAYIIQDGLNRVAELYPIPNHEMRVDRSPTTRKLRYYVNGQEVPTRSILHLRGLTFNGITGADAVTHTRDAISLAIALQDHAAKYFPNSVSPSMVLTAPGNLTPEQIKHIKKEILDRAQGGANAHLAMLLLGGTQAAFPQIGDNQKGQFLESRVRQDMAICQVFGVPQIKAGITDKAHYNNVEQENRNFVTDTLMPWAVQWEQALNMKLLGPVERGRYFFEFDFNGLLRADIQARAAAYDIFLRNGITNRNEVRAMENLNPVPGGDQFVISQNVQLLDTDGSIVPDPSPAETESQSQ